MISSSVKDWEPRRPQMAATLSKELIRTSWACVMLSMTVIPNI